MTQIIGPVPTITFHGGPGRLKLGATRQVYSVPRDTLDPRFAACTDHHPACDCREAGFAEVIGELRAELRAVRAAAREVLHAHRLINTDADYLNGFGPCDWQTYKREAGALACQCTGCQIVRRTEVLNSHDYSLETGVIQ